MTRLLQEPVQPKRLDNWLHCAGCACGTPHASKRGDGEDFEQLEEDAVNFFPSVAQH